MSSTAASLAAVRAQFGPTAGAYAISRVHAGGPDLEAMLAAASLTGTERVLDLGTGAGHTALAFAPHSAEVVGIDVTPEMIAVAQQEATRRGLANVRYEEADASKLPFSGASFDLVLSRHCAHHLAEPLAALREARRVLKRGGRFLLVDAVAPEDAALDTFLNTVEFLRDYSHVRDWRASEWVRMFGQAGFEAQVLDRIPLPLDGDDWVARMRTPGTKAKLLRELFREANAAQRAVFDIRDEPWGFTLDVALLAATAV
ncbi:MAG: class I SAM-dependent methyltransferase [Dehalococcoidia bacterium]|nr:class I SAM-dependent methyltransferase [Dehalococcoidia bacterium]